MTKLWAILIVIFLVKVVNSFCPDNCVCDIWQQLRRTQCSNNKLTTIEYNIHERTQALDISRNIIYTIPDHGFVEQNLIDLIFLNISKNHIGYLSLRSFEGLSNLQIVDLSHNTLSTIIPHIFITNIKLKTLLLEGNNFVTLDPAPFIISKSLRVLNINKCLISHIYEENFSKLPALESLELNGNLLMDINANCFEELKNLQNLDLNNNLLICDNQYSLDLKRFCLTNAIVCSSKCLIIEKSQKIQMEQASPDIEQITTEENIITWDIDDLNEVTTEQILTTSSTINTEKCSIIIPVLIAFSCGLGFGMCNVGLCVLIFTCAKRRKERKDDFILNEEFANWSLNSSVPHTRLVNEPFDNIR